MIQWGYWLDSEAAPGLYSGPLVMQGQNLCSAVGQGNELGSLLECGCKTASVVGSPARPHLVG